MKEKILAFAKELKIEYAGIVSAQPMQSLKALLKRQREINGIMPFEEADLEKRTDPSKTLPGAKSIIVFLFPYSANAKEGNLSKYARIPDYHHVVMAYLQKLCDYIHTISPESRMMPFVDNGPLVDKYLAYLAGLGFYGKNKLLINEKYGSFFFIGYIITDLELKSDKPIEKTCLGCDACMKNCPGGALGKNGGFCAQKCVSYLTQAKELTKSQQEILKKQPYVYGCDVCQKVCPQNEEIPETPILEFSSPKLFELEEETILKMSAREFRRVYKEYPFSWRGKAAILKNFSK